MPQNAHPKPTCQICSAPMALDGVVPCAEGYDMRSHSCSACKFRFSVVEARTAESPAVPERRLVSRYGVTKTATIEADDRMAPCVVRDVSAAGADVSFATGVSLASQMPIPGHFVLVVDGSHLPCRVIWHQEKRMGVAFS